MAANCFHTFFLAGAFSVSSQPIARKKRLPSRDASFSRFTLFGRAAPCQASQTKSNLVKPPAHNDEPFQLQASPLAFHPKYALQSYPRSPLCPAFASVKYHPPAPLQIPSCPSSFSSCQNSPRPRASFPWAFVRENECCLSQSLSACQSCPQPLRPLRPSREEFPRFLSPLPGWPPPGSLVTTCRKKLKSCLVNSGWMDGFLANSVPSASPTTLLPMPPARPSSSGARRG